MEFIIVDDGSRDGTLAEINVLVGLNMNSRHRAMRGIFLPAVFLLIAAQAGATEGHVLAKGTVFNAATYVGHPKYGTHPSYYGNSPEQVADINIGEGSWDDDGTPLFAPEDGIVTIIHYNTDNWGHSIEWRNAAGTERLFLAHLRRINAVGLVHSGEEIGEIGGTGGWNPHLHLESASGWIVLSGRELRPPVNPRGNGQLYVSNGPLPADKDDAPADEESVVAIPAANGSVHDLAPTQDSGGGQHFAPPAKKSGGPPLPD
jgi:hypothetical protein